jgi:hypothetical protein
MSGVANNQVDLSPYDLLGMSFGPNKHMRILLAALLFAQLSSAEIVSMTWGAQNNYSNQLTGINGFPNNGRKSDGDSTRACWAANGNTYVTGNDGNGPQSTYGGSGGRTVFLTTMSPFTVPSAGVLQTPINGMDSYGTINQDIYGAGVSIKSAGLDCQNGRLYLSIYHQNQSINAHGNMVNIMQSSDNGVTWSKPANVNHTTGVPSSSSATGDLPGVSEAMFDTTTDIKSIYFAQLCQDGSISCPDPATVEGCGDISVWKCVIAESSLAQHIYAGRVRIADMTKSDGSFYQWFKGTPGTCSADESYGAIRNKVATEPAQEAGTVVIVSPPLYVPASKAWVIWVGGAANAFYQAPSICGPWKQLFLPPINDEGWEAPMLQSMSTVGNVTTIVYMTTFGPSERTADELNRYNPIFHVATFTAAPGISSSQVTGVTNPSRTQRSIAPHTGILHHWCFRCKAKIRQRGQ